MARNGNQELNATLSAQRDCAGTEAERADPNELLFLPPIRNVRKKLKSAHRQFRKLDKRPDAHD